MTTASRTEASALDVDLLRDLEALLGEDFALLVSTYRGDLDAKRTLLAEAWRQGNLAALGEHAHSLKGASQNIGALAIAELCEALESDGRRGSGERIDVLLGRLDEAAEWIGRALERGDWR